MMTKVGGAVLTAARYARLLAAEVVPVSVPAGPLRRHGRPARVAECVADVRARILDAPEADWRIEPLGAAAEMAIELSSYLFVAGAPHPQWRRWANLAALGLALQGRWLDAGGYAAVGGDQDFVESLRGRDPGQAFLADELWPLLTGGSLPAWDGDESVRGWWWLEAALASADAGAVSVACTELAEAVFGEDEEGDWADFHPHSYPDFDPALSAAAALAMSRGVAPHGLRPEVAHLFAAGLATGAGAPLNPELYQHL